jgi:hypothetical protein
MAKSGVGSASSTMKVSELIKILESVKRMYGDLPVWGECGECQTADLYVWVLTAASEMDAVIIQVSSLGGDD